MQSEPIRLSVILLAAGQSRRMGAQNKLLRPFAGTTVLEAALQAVLQAQKLLPEKGVDLSEIIVVVGHQSDKVESRLQTYPVRCVQNPDYTTGMGSSLACGVQASRRHSRGLMIFPGDLPAVRPDSIVRTAAAFAAGKPGRIVRPVYGERAGHPVIFDPLYRDELIRLRGDAGGKSVVAAHPSHLHEIPVNDPGVVQDFDTPEDFQRSSST